MLKVISALFFGALVYCIPANAQNMNNKKLAKILVSETTVVEEQVGYW